MSKGPSKQNAGTGRALGNALPLVATTSSAAPANGGSQTMNPSSQSARPAGLTATKDRRLARLMDLAEFEVSAVQDDTAVRGNTLASGDDSYDRQVENGILGRLYNGDTWAWAAVTVRASYKGFSGEDHLGCCSYEDEKDFKTAGGYYPDMKWAAAQALLNELGEADEALEDLETVKDEYSSDGGYVRLRINANGDLELRPTRELYNEYRGGLDKKSTDSALAEILEDHAANGEIRWISPEDIGALTDAPMLALESDVETNEEGELKDVKRIFFHDRYMIDDPIVTMLRDDVVVFKAHKSKD